MTGVWLPPGCKANSPHGNGYDCYDLWDLGEFDQKGSRATKWGSVEELEELITVARSLGVQVIWDAVLNHKTAGDATEECWAVEVDPEDRRREITPPKKIEPWIYFSFPGRGAKYSSLRWHWQHFNGTDWDQRAQKNAIYKIIDPPSPSPSSLTHPLPIPNPKAATNLTATGRRQGKDWAPDVSSENGNGDYLMFSNIDYTHAAVRADVLAWGEWMLSHRAIAGFRLDAVQHYSWTFTAAWIRQVQRAGAQQQRDRPVAIIGEYWVGDTAKLRQWLDAMPPGVRTFDAPLLYSFARLSGADAETESGSEVEVDLRRVFTGTLTEARPQAAVTLVANHDTQAGQTMAAPIAAWFRPLAYALILLREKAMPCVFFGDLYGTRGPFAEPQLGGAVLPALVLCRKVFAYGRQMEYFDARTSVGWTRLGTWDRADGCAVVMSVAGPARKRMFVGKEKGGQRWVDVLGEMKLEVVVDERGYGVFGCLAKGVGVWVNREVAGSTFPVRFDTDIYGA